MKKILLLLNILITTNVIGQRLEENIEQDTTVTIFNLNKYQLQNIIEKNLIADTNWYYENFNSKQSINRFDNSKLPFGNYLITKFIRHNILNEVFRNEPFTIKTNYINNDAIIFLIDKKTNETIKSAKIFYNNTAILYDSGYGGYAIDEKKLQFLNLKTNKNILRINYLQNDYVNAVQINKKTLEPKTKPNYGTISSGYVILDKPIYKPKDTLKLKAFLVNNKNGEPITEKAILQISEPSKNFNFITTIKPKEKGDFVWQWKIPDTLTIDKTYYINITYKYKGKTYIQSKTFYLEDYTLAKNIFNASANKKTFYYGEDISFNASATDANHFPLSNVHINYKLKLAQINNLLKDTLLLSLANKNLLYEKDTILPYDRINTFSIPSNSILKADAQYNLDVTIINPVTYERKQFTIAVNKVNQTVNTLFYQSADSVAVRVLYNNKDTQKNYQFIALNKGDTIFNKKITTPLYYKLSPNCTNIVLINDKNIATNLPIFFNALEITRTKYSRTIDSVHFGFANPFNTNIYYKIYKNNIVIQSGETKNLKYDGIDNTNSKYTIIFTQLLANSIANHFYSITIEPPLHQLQIQNNLPVTAFPGQQLVVNMHIADANGIAMNKINIASFAQNAQFGDRLQTPYITVPAPYYHLANVQLLPELSVFQILPINTLAYNNILPKHISRFNLHKNEWYQLYHPLLQASTITIPTLNNQSEYCVVIEKNHQLYTPKYVIDNNDYVYINDATETKNYSILATINKEHFIEIRYANYLLHLNPITFKKNQKTIIVIRADSLEFRKPLVALINKIDSMSALVPTVLEKQNMLHSIALVSGINFSDSIFLIQKNIDSINNNKQIFLTKAMIIGSDRFDIIGPIAKNSEATISINNKLFNLNKGLQTNYYENYLQSITTRDYANSIVEQLFAFQESIIDVSQLFYKTIADTIKIEPKNSIGKLNNYKVKREVYTNEKNYYQQYENYSSNKNCKIIIQNNNDSIYTKAIWVVYPQDYKNSIFKPNITKTNFLYLNTVALVENFDIYLLLNNQKIIKIKNMHFNDNDELYINPVYCKLSNLMEHDLDSALWVYNKITAIPMIAFNQKPIEVEGKAKEKINTKLKNTYIHGLVYDNQLQPIPNAIIIAEINGKYQTGALTNEKGEYEFLNLPSATYMFKIYANNYALLNILPQSYNNAKEYTLNILLENSTINEPLWETHNNDFRLMAFIRNEMENKLLVNGYDIDTRVPLTDVEIELEQEGKIKSKNNISLNKEIEFLNTKNNITIYIKKQGYKTIKIEGVKCENGFYYVMDFFMEKINAKYNTASNYYNLDMNDLEQLKIENINTSENVIINYEANDKDKNSIKGILKNKNKYLENTEIDLLKDNKLIKKTTTNNTGEFVFNGLNDGDYEIKINKSVLIQNINLKENICAIIEIEMPNNYKKINAVVLKSKNKRPALIIDAAKAGSDYNYSSNNSNAPIPLDAKKIEMLATTNTLDATNLVGGNYQAKKGGVVHINGGRNENTVYIVDGMITRNGIVNKDEEDNGIENLEKNVEQDKLNTDLNFLLQDTTYNAIRKNFTDIGYWQPNIWTDKNGNATFTIKLPDNITTWKAYTLAMGNKFMHAIKTQEIAVYKPLQTMSVVPSFLYKGDMLNAKANFINLTEKPKLINTYIKINDKIVLQDSATIDKQIVKKYTLQANTTDSIVWQAGMQFESNYKDAEQFKIPVYNSIMQTFTNQNINMENDSLYELLVTPNTKGTIIFNNLIYEKIMIYINELNNYEYGCAEQTASKLKAMLFKQSILKALDNKKDVTNTINFLINKLRDLQNKQNTWGWWKGQNTNWDITLYACDVLQTANSMGFKNSEYYGGLLLANKNLQNLDINNKLYAMYLLQQTGLWNQTTTDNFNTINIEYLNTTSKMYYYKIKLNNKEIVSDADMYSIFLELNNKRNYYYESNFFYEPKADWFRAYLLFKNTKWDNDMMIRFKQYLLYDGAEKNLNTFTKALLIEALVQKSKAEKANDILSTVIINDTLKISKFPYTLPIKSTIYKIKHSGAPVFLNTAEQIIIDEPTIKDSAFAIQTSFSNTLQTGKPTTLKINLEAYRTSNYVMVEIPIPSGLQIINKQQGNSEMYMEYYKNKIIIFYNTISKGMHEINFDMQPIFSGTFTMPAAKACLMYYPFVYGCNKNKSVVIE